MLIDKLIEKGKLNAQPYGYGVQAFGTIIRIDAAGNLLGVETPEKPLSLLAPAPSASATSGVLATTWTATHGYAFGVYAPGVAFEGRPSRLAADYARVMAQVDHPAARAVLAFLRNPNRPAFVATGHPLSPEQLATVRAAPPVYLDREERNTAAPLVTRNSLTTDPMTLGAYRVLVDAACAAHPLGSGAQVVALGVDPASRICFEVEGHPQWWLSPVVQAAHRDRLNEASGEIVRGTCSMCGAEDVVLARLIRKTRIGSLCSFKEAAWSAYGREQAYNVPTCQDCGEAITQGHDALLADHDVTNRQGDRYFLWWSDQPGTTLWATLEAALDTRDPSHPDATPPEARAAALALLEGMPRTYLGIFEPMMGRCAARRFHVIEPGTVAERVRRWLSVGGAPLWLTAKAFRPRKRDEEKEEKGGQPDAAYIRWYERLVLTLVCGEPLPERDAREIRRRLKGNEIRTTPERGVAYTSFTARRMAAILTFAGAETPLEYAMTADQLNALPPMMLAAYYLGCAAEVATRIQIGRSDPQVTFRVSHYPTWSCRPSLARVELAKRASFRLRGQTKVLESRQMADALAAADAAIGAAYPVRASQAEQAMFYRGALSERVRHESVRAAAKAEEPTDQETINQLEAMAEAK